MMIKFKLIVAFLLLFSGLRAQNGLDSLQALYDDLDSNNITSGILFDRAPYVQGLFANPKDYDGILNKKPCYSGDFFDLHTLMELGSYGTTVPDPADFNTDLQNELAQNYQVPLGLLNFDYQHIDSIAVEDSIIGWDTATQKFFDIPGQNPYNDHRLFAGAQFSGATTANTVVTIPWLNYHMYTVTYKLPSSLYLTNVTSTVENLQIDYDDGNGYVSVNFDQIKSITYTDQIAQSGESPWVTKMLRIKIIHDLQGNYHETFVPIKIGVVPPPDLTIDIDQLPLPSCVVEPEDGYGYAQAQGYVVYGDDVDFPERIDKPVIFIEGFDSGREAYGNQNWVGFQSGYFNTEDVDDLLPQLRKLPVLTETLTALGYDVIIVDFKDGVDDMRNNGASVIRLIQWVNDQMQQEGLDNEIVVSGASMGGVIARYSLLRIEESACCHNVSVYATLDSPHQGANIPLGVQAFIRNLGYNLPVEKVRKQYEQVVRSPAAMQLMQLHVNSTHDIFQTGAWTRITNPWANPLPSIANDRHTGFYGDLDEMGGHPRYCTRLGIANGSATAQPGPFANGAKLIDLAIDINAPISYPANLSLWMLSGSKVYALSPNSNNVLVETKGVLLTLVSTVLYVKNMATYYIGLPFHFILFGLIDGVFEGIMSGLHSTNNALSLNTYQGGPYPLLDNAVGSTTNTMELIAGQFKPFLTASQKSHTFVPSLSALDIDDPNLSLHIQSTLTNDPTRTPFDQVWYPGFGDTGPSVNQAHVAISDPLITWFVQQIQDAQYPLTTAGSGLYKNLQTNFNYGRPSLKTIHRLDVSANGKLLINNRNYGLDYGQGGAVTGGSDFTAYTHGSSCGGSWIIVNNGGRVELGDNLAGAHTGNLVISDGTFLEVKNGGRLVINDDSRLLIEAGGELILHPGSIVELNGTNAVLELKGKITLKPNTILDPLGDGFIRLNQVNPGTSSLWEAQGNNEVRLSQSGGTHKALEVVETARFPVQLDLLKITSARVEIANGKQLEVMGGFETQNTTYAGLYGANSHNGLRVFGQSVCSISSCTFDGGNYGLHALLTFFGNDLTVSDCDFENQQVAGLYTSGKGVDVLETRFTDCEIGWKAVNTTHDCSMIQAQFDRCVTAGVDMFGQAGVYFLVRDSRIEDSPTGLKAEHVSVRMLCTEIKECTYGIEAINARVYLDDHAANEVTNNTIGVRIFDGMEVKLANGRNHLFNSSSFSLYGNLDPNHLMGFSPTLNVSVNNAPLIGGGLPYLLTHAGGSTVPVTNYTNSGQHMTWTCANNLSPLSANVSLYPGGRIINTDHYEEMTFTAAMTDAVGYVSFGGTTNDDLTALERLQEILAVNLNNPNEDELYLRNFGLLMMYKALANAYEQGLLDLNRADAGQTPNGYMMMVLDELDARINELDNEDPLADEKASDFNLAKAQVYRLGEYYDHALSILDESNDWATEGDEEEAAYWTCVCTAENDLLTNNLSVAGFLALSEQCANEQQNRLAVDPLLPHTQPEEENGLDKTVAVNLFPNPTNGWVTIESEGTDAALTYELRTIQGALVREPQMGSNSGTFQLSLEDLPTGVYLLTVRNGDAVVEVKKVTRL